MFCLESPTGWCEKPICYDSNTCLYKKEESDEDREQGTGTD